MKTEMVQKKKKTLKLLWRDIPMRSDIDREYGSTPERFKIQRSLKRARADKILSTPWKTARVILQAPETVNLRVSHLSRKVCAKLQEWNKEDSTEIQIRCGILSSLPFSCFQNTARDYSDALPGEVNSLKKRQWSEME